MTATDTLAHLLTAIDAGDDFALVALADWLEGEDDPRAVGLRIVGDHSPHGSGTWSLYDEDDHQAPLPWELDEATFESLSWPQDREMVDRIHRCYPTRSAAFLALAQALTAK